LDLKTDNTILSIRNLRVDFKTGDRISHAVRGIDFDLYKNEILAIVGESGSGKSVTAMSVMRLLKQPPAQYPAGQILFNDENKVRDLLQLEERELQKIRGRQISMIFQEPMSSLNPVMKCGPQVAEVLTRHFNTDKKAAREKVLEWFDRVKLPSPERIYDAYPHQLSGGQIQRVMISMALCGDPMAIIADEPTTALDVTVQKKILEIIKDIRREFGTSVIFITHDLGVVSEIADRVLVMYKGLIVEEGSVSDVFSNPRHPYTKSLLACKPPLDIKLKRLPVVSDFLDIVRGDDQKISFINKDTNIREILRNKQLSPVESAERIQKLGHADTLLTVKDLTSKFVTGKSFLGKPTSWNFAVNDVSFEVKKGETLGLVGESGCGKTTLGRTIVRLMEESSGNIVFDNLPLNKIKGEKLRKLRKRFQIIFQDPYSSLNPKMTVGEAIMEPMTVHNILKTRNQRKEKAIDLLETVQLDAEYFDRYPHEFSGGQRQRICIARALALNPEFIIFDESVAALDVSVQAQILNLLTDIRDRLNLTYIFITHDLSVVRFIADRVIVMKQGKIEEQGTPEDIFDNPQSVYTRNLIASIPKIELI